MSPSEEGRYTHVISGHCFCGADAMQTNCPQRFHLRNGVVLVAFRLALGSLSFIQSGLKYSCNGLQSWDFGLIWENKTPRIYNANCVSPK